MTCGHDGWQAGCPTCEAEEAEAMGWLERLIGPRSMEEAALRRATALELADTLRADHDALD